MMNAGPSGFVHAPVTKGMMLASVGLTLLSSALQAKNAMILASHADLLRNRQFWRIFTHQLTFRSAGELIVGNLLLYQMRVFERQMGSRKFGSFAVLVSVLSTTMQLAMSIRGFGNTASGLYAPIFASMVLFFQAVPVSRHFRVCGIPLSDKFVVYLLSLQLAFSSFPSSLLSAGCGVLSGLLFSSPLLPLHRFKLPSFFCRICSKLLLPLLRSSPNHHNHQRNSNRNNNNGGGEVAMEGQGFRDRLLGGDIGGGGGGGIHMAARPHMARMMQMQQQQQGFHAPAPTPPSAANIAALEAMGFPAHRASEALMRNNDNLEAAADFLLNHH